MFHFWFNTFFVDVEQMEHMATPKSDGRGRTPRSTTTASASVKQHSALPSSYVKSVPPSSSSSVAQRGVEHANNRTVDRVIKTAATRTASGTSSASSGTHSSVSYRRGSQQHDRPSVRPHSVHLSGTQTVSNHLDSAASSKVSQTGRGPRDKLQTSGSGSSTISTSRSKPIQEPRNGPHMAPVLAGSRSKIASQERKGSISSVSSAPQERKSSITSVSSARRGHAGSVRAVERERCVGRSDSVKVSRPKGEIARTTPNHNGTLHARTRDSGSQKPTEKNAVNDEAADQQSELAATTKKKSSISSVSSAPLMKPSSSTPTLSKTTKTDSATSQSVRQPNPSTKASSAVSRYAQRDVASKRSLQPSKTGPSQRLVFSRQMSEHAAIKHGESTGSLVSHSVQARSEGLPSDPVSLTRFSPHNSRQYTSAGLVTTRPLLGPAESQSAAVFEVSGSSFRPDTFCTLTLMKSEIDKANKDVQHKVYSSDFKVSLLHIFCCLCQSK